LLPCEEQSERAGVGDTEVIADEDAYGGESLCGGEDVLCDDIQSGALDEAGEDIDVCGAFDAIFEEIPELRIRGSGGQRGLCVAGVGSGRCVGGWCGGCCEVVGEVWDDVANAAAWVGDITCVAGDEMDVEVWDGLSGSGSAVESDVVTVGGGLESFVEELLDGVDELEDGGLFRGGGVEPCWDEAAGDDQCVSG
jgi:hypothetical protein